MAGENFYQQQFDSRNNNSSYQRQQLDSRTDYNYANQEQTANYNPYLEYQLPYRGPHQNANGPSYVPPYDYRYPIEAQQVNPALSRQLPQDQPIYVQSNSPYRPVQGGQLAFDSPYPIQGRRPNPFENTRDYTPDQVAASISDGHLSSELYTMVQKLYANGGVRPVQDFILAVNSRLLNTPYYFETQEQARPDGQDALIINLRDKRDSGVRDIHGLPISHGTIFLRPR